MMKRLWMVLVFLLFWVAWLNVGMASAATAERVTLVEVSSGECYDGACYGYTLVGELDGEMAGTLTLTLNYTPDQFGPNASNALSGYWVIDTSPNDFLFGSISSGSLEWNGGGRVANLTADLTIEGGQGIYAGMTDSGTVDGKLWDRPDADRARVILTLGE
jgi:hypothetical protein